MARLALDGHDSSVAQCLDCTPGLSLTLRLIAHACAFANIMDMAHGAPTNNLQDSIYKRQAFACANAEAPEKLKAVQEEQHGQGHVTFVVDSTYAINMATGRTAPRRDERARTLCS